MGLPSLTTLAETDVVRGSLVVVRTTCTACVRNLEDVEVGGAISASRRNNELGPLAFSVT